MKSEYGTQMMTFPKVRFEKPISFFFRLLKKNDFIISYSMKGERYSVEFIADQRRCDIYLLYMTIMDTYEKNKEKCSFQIKNVTTFKENNFTTLQIDFEEAFGDPKKSKK